MDWYTDMMSTPSEARRFVSLSILLIIGFFSVLGLFSVIDPYPLKDWIYLRLTLQKIGISGAILFIIIVATMPLAAPLSLLIMAGSSAYGAPIGMALSYLGCLINANITFFLVKALGIENAWGHGKKTHRVKTAIQNNGYPLVLIIQMLTIIPFTAINSAAAASGICWRDFMKATILGIVPSIAIFSLLGNLFVTKFLSPRFYFAFICAVAFVILLIALLKKDAQLRSKAVSELSCERINGEIRQVIQDTHEGVRNPGAEHPL
jgi:uncharacterized membrane protein YdjX (TVP38/TMEM64 family)